MGAAIYRSRHTPEPRNHKKVSKRSSRASPPGVSKKCRQSPPNTDFAVSLTRFRVFWDFFDTFSTLWAGRPGEDGFETFLGFRGSGVWRLLYMAAPIVNVIILKTRVFQSNRNISNNFVSEGKLMPRHEATAVGGLHAANGPCSMNCPRKPRHLRQAHLQALTIQGIDGM